MYEIAVRDIPARSLLTLLRYVHADEQIPVGATSSSNPKDEGQHGLRVTTSARGEQC